MSQAGPRTRLARIARAGWLFAPLPLLGCGTLNSGASGCFGPYSGVRQDLELLSALGAEPAETEVRLGIDGTLADVWDGIFVAFDLPLSFVADTAVAPVSLATGPQRPEPAGLGCGWSVAPDPERAASSGDDER